MNQIVTELGNLLQHLMNATITGFSNISTNPSSLAFFLVGAIVLSFRKKIKQIIWLAIALFALGYGSIVIDGIRMLNDVVTQIQP